MRFVLALMSIGWCFGQPTTDAAAWTAKRVVSVDYPQLAIQARMQGEIIVDCTLDAVGHVMAAKVVESAGMADQARLLLGQAVLENVKQWRFQRASEGTGSKVRLRYTFTLENDTSGKRGTRFVFEYPNHVYVSSPYMFL